MPRNDNQTIITKDEKGYWFENSESFKHFDSKDELIEYIKKVI